MSDRKLTLKLLFFIGMVSALWGPKIGGYFDLMVLVPSVLLLLLTAIGQVAAPKEFYIATGGIAIVATAWVGMSIFVNGQTDPQGILRSVRAFITVLVLVPVFYYAASRQIVSLGTACKFLIAALFFNTAAIYVQVMFVPLQDLMAPLWGFNKPIRDVRAFGLTAGYDTAGYLAAFLATSILTASLAFRSWRWFAFFLVCSGAVGFTSRTSMLMLGGLVIVVLIMSIPDLRRNKAKVAFTLSGGFVAVIWYVLPRVFSGISELAVLSAYNEHSFSSVYAHTSLHDILERMVLIPRELSTWLIGSGLIVPWSDIGYIKVLYLGGVPLLGFMFLFYLFLFMVSLFSVKRLCKSGKVGCSDNRWLRVWSIQIWLFLLVMFVGNFKNLYFFTRGYHELFVVVASLMLGFQNGRIGFGRVVIEKNAQKNV